MTFDFTSLGDHTIATLPAKKRRKRTMIPTVVLWHTTNGPGTAANQFPGTVNWFTSNSNGGSTWGPSSDILIGTGGELLLFVTDTGEAFDTTHAAFSAGYGDSWRTTYAADEYAISIEVARSASQEPISQAALSRLVEVTAVLCNHYGIPVQWIDYLHQKRSLRPQQGVTGHEFTANGKKTGKIDPGLSKSEISGLLERVRTSNADAGDPKLNRQQLTIAYTMAEMNRYGHSIEWDHNEEVRGRKVHVYRMTVPSDRWY